jgi:cold shock CspA family protein
MSDDREQGTVKWFNRDRQFGFIVCDWSGDEVHVSQKQIRDGGTLESEMRVEFELKRDADTGRLWARNVRQVVR